MELSKIIEKNIIPIFSIFNIMMILFLNVINDNALQDLFKWGYLEIVSPNYERLYVDNLFFNVLKTLYFLMNFLLFLSLKRYLTNFEKKIKKKIIASKNEGMN